MKIIKTFEEFINSKTVDKPEDTTSPEDIQTAPGDNAGDEETKKDLEEPADDETIVSFDTDTDTVEDDDKDDDDVTAGAEDSEEESEDDEEETITLDPDTNPEDEEEEEEEE
jgi:hypothetical protein